MQAKADPPEMHLDFQIWFSFLVFSLSVQGTAKRSRDSTHVLECKSGVTQLSALFIDCLSTDHERGMALASGRRK